MVPCKCIIWLAWYEDWWKQGCINIYIIWGIMIAQSALALPIATILEKEKKRKDLIFSRDFFVSLCCASAGCRRPRIASE